MNVLGISAFYHDSAAAIVRNGQVLAAAQQERFSRRKFDEEFPVDAIAYCLNETGLALDDLDYVGFYDKPLLTFNRLLETYLAYTPSGFPSFVKAIPIWVKQKVFQKSLILKGLNQLDRGKTTEKKILFDFHHDSHAASAFFPSPFDRAAILVMDGVGEWATTSMGIGSDSGVKLLKEIRFPHSLGMLYSAFTYYLGFKVNDGEYKVMGLAPYGEPKYVQKIYDNLIQVFEDGSYKLNMDYFGYCTGLKMTNDRFDQLFEAPRRSSAEPLTQREMDIASSVQVVTEEIVLRICRTLYELTGEKNLCMAGGVALNCVANGRILREGRFENIWVQPAAGDAGGALGVALSICHTMGNGAATISKNTLRDGMYGSYLGPEFNSVAIRAVLDRVAANYSELSENDLLETVAKALAEGKIVGWFQGRMEFGPRALGNRSILADPNLRDMQKILNLRIKYRESFRPFAPAVLREDVGEYFDIDCDSPYMLLVAPVNDARWLPLTDEEERRQGLDKLQILRSDIPAVTHVDYSARIQTVQADTNPRFYNLLKAFKDQTGRSVLVNTSFNVRDEPIVCSPDDAYRCFMATEMDVLACGNFLLFKEEQ